MTWNPDIDGFRKNRGMEEIRKFDPHAHAVTTISEPHRMTHDGFMFHVSYKHETIVNGGTEDILLKVPAGSFPHLNRVNVNAGAGDININLYEATTVSADGTALSVHNTNRNSTNVSAMLVYNAPTVTDVGTEIHHQWIPPSATGTGLSVDGITNAEQGEEWLLAQNENYLIRLENTSGNTIDAWIEILFYEIGYER